MRQALWESLPELSTTRLTLRPLTEADRDALFAIYGDAEVMRYASDEPFADVAVVDRMLTSVQRLYAARESLEWGVALRQSGALIGTCGLHSFGQDRSGAEVGCLLARAYWGRGLMREVLELVIGVGFGALDLSELRAEIDAPNTRSHALFTRLGFARDAASGISTLHRTAGSAASQHAR